MIVDNSEKKESSFYEPEDRGYLITEAINEKSRNLDKLSTNQLVQLFSIEDLKPQKAVSLALTEIEKSIDKIAYKLEKGGRLFYLGSGTSGRLGVLDSAECPPTFCTDPELVQGIIAGGYQALYKSSENLEDSCEDSKNELVSRNFSNKDVLVGITAGGTTPFVISALQYSLSIKSLTIAISCVPKEQVSIPCNIDIRLVTGPEILAGSTRLKGGTATKMALNMISTGVMIKLGKVYNNRMVDLSAKNSKLIDRSIRILQDLSNINRKDGIRLLNEAKGSVKLALLSSLAGISIEQAKILLNSNKNNLRETLENLGIK